MQTISNVCSFIAIFELITAPILLIIWLVRKIRKKPKMKWFKWFWISFVAVVAAGVLTSPSTWCKHEYRLVDSKAPDCTTDGYETYHCDLCGRDMTKKIERLGHDMRERSQVKPTYEDDGKLITRCSRCGYEEIEVLKKLSESVNPEQDNTENPETEIQNEKNTAGATAEHPTDLTDEEWERVQAIFAEYVGKEIEHKPVYCGEWREGRQYKTENYAYGQYLINMDDDGYVHLVVWVQDKKGEEGQEVVYNRLEDENAPTPEPVVKGGIRIIDNELGEYGKTVQLYSYEYVWYMVPAGKYEATANVNTCTVYVDKNEITRNSSGFVEMENVATYRWKYGETIIIEVGDDEHLFNVVGADYTLTSISE